MFVVDTDILVYASDPDAELHRTCRERLEDWGAHLSPWYVSWPICYEFLRICTHPRVFRKPWPIAAGWEFLEVVLARPSAGTLLPTAQHLAVLGDVIRDVPQVRGNVLHDVHTAVLMREHGIKEIYTCDMDFHRFAFLRVLDPRRD